MPLDIAPDEILPSGAKADLSTFLEDPKGRECCVFIISGQRQDAWDNSFIVRDLGLKYLRSRMLIVVDLDGLAPEALAEIMQGSRQGFFQGEVYHAIRNRMIATLKKDPDLERLEADAERQISELRAGDEAVKSALDQLIDDHHAHAPRQNAGTATAGCAENQAGTMLGPNRRQNVVIEPDPTTGRPTTGPFLVSVPPSQIIRIHPSVPRQVFITAYPESAWQNVEGFDAALAESVDGLTLEIQLVRDGAELTICFTPPKDLDDDEYPIDAAFTVMARFRGHAEPRLLEREIKISPPGKRAPRPKPILLDDPTELHVTSRQPVRLLRGGADKHVRMRWNGKDTLLMGAPPPWRFSARCTPQTAFPAMTFTKPAGGRFELLVPVPAGLDVGERLDFSVEAVGPGGKVLKTSFSAEVVEPALPRRTKKKVSDTLSHRRPPYDLRYVEQKQWNEAPFWNGDSWSQHDAGYFAEPTDSAALVLFINQDMQMLREYQDGLVARKLEPNTIEERVTRYTSHVAFHLYQMYLTIKHAESVVEGEPAAAQPADEQMRGAINRVATTLIGLMQVRR